MNEISVHLAERSYSVLIKPGCLSEIGHMVSSRAHGNQVAIITDQTVAALFGDCVMQSFQREGLRATLHVVPDGEHSKSLDQAAELYSALITSNLRRDGLVIALGGGVVGDLAGFVASTYLRGVRFVQVPTTLLAQVDSSVGGKVGINHPLGKNLIGCFHQPSLICIDVLALRTLNRRDTWAGLGEVVKYGLICDDNIFSSLEAHLEKLAEGSNVDSLSAMVSLCCRAKAGIVEQDEKEKGLRRILNFGHTMGHALEVATGFSRYRHGEAIVYGMRWASWLSSKQGVFPETEFCRTDRLLKKFPVPPLPDDLSGEQLLSFFSTDKKQTAKGLALILLEKIGKACIIDGDIRLALVDEWLDEVRREK